MISNARARKRDSKLYLRNPSNDADADDTAVRLLWPHAPASLDVDVDSFLVKIGEKDLGNDEDVKKDAPAQSEEGAYDIGDADKGRVI